MTFIKTKRLLLRSLVTSDAKRLQALGNNKKIWENLTDSFPHPYTYDDAKNWININSDKEFPENFAVTLENELIGMVGFSEKGDFFEVGYWLGEPYWSKGYATEVLDAFTKYLFDTYKIKFVRAKVFLYNNASGRVLEKCGYKKQNYTLSTTKAGKEQKEFVYIKCR